MTVLQTIHTLHTLDSATSLNCDPTTVSGRTPPDHRIRRQNHHKMQRPVRPIGHHKYSQKRLDILAGVVPEPDRQIQQEHSTRANTYQGIDNRSNGGLVPRFSQRPEMSRPTPTDAEYWETAQEAIKTGSATHAIGTCYNRSSPRGILAVVPWDDGLVPTDR